MPATSPPLPSSAPSSAPPAPTTGAPPKGIRNAPRSPYLNAPRTVPTAVPQTSPQVSGPGVIVAVMVDQMVRARCHPGATTEVGRDRPETENTERAQVKRQRPCPRGRPEVSYEPKEIKIGRFSMEKATQYILINAAKTIQERSKQMAVAKGYNRHKDDIPVRAVLSPPKGYMEKILSRTRLYCHYQVSVFETQRKCYCPDGSPCRRTVRK